MDVVKLMSVRELIVELSQVEDALRQTCRPSRHAGPVPVVEDDVAGLVHREQVIVYELRRRARARRRGQRPAGSSHVTPGSGTLAP